MSKSLAERAQELYVQGVYEIVWEDDTHQAIYFPDLGTFETLEDEGFPNYFFINKQTSKLEHATTTMEQVRHISSFISSPEEEDKATPISFPH